MSLYKFLDKDLKSLQKTDFHLENVQERRDLQSIFKKRIEVISPDLMVISEEFSEWDESGRRIDLLAIDKNANLVVIELKRSESGNHMELQAIRYAAMVSNMTWEKAKDTFQDYLNDNSLDDNSNEQMDAESEICDFLGWDSPREEDFAENVRILLVSADFSKELTTSVLWLNERELDITCVRLSLHKIDDSLILSVDQIIPLPETDSYQIKVREKRREKRISQKSNKDRTLYTIEFDGNVYKYDFKKSDIGLFTVELLNKHNLIDESVFQFLREDTSCRFRLIKLESEVTETERKYRKYRVNNPPELIYSGEEYYVARNWGVDNVGIFIQKFEEEFPSIKIYPSSIN